VIPASVSVSIEPTLDDHGALACGDGSERAAQSFRIQLSPHKPPADVHLERDTRGSWWHGNTEEPRGFAESFNGFIVKAVTPRGARLKAETLTERQDRRQAHIYPLRPDT
jgi:hypothetical protein